MNIYLILTYLLINLILELLKWERNSDVLVRRRAELASALTSYSSGDGDDCEVDWT